MLMIDSTLQKLPSLLAVEQRPTFGFFLDIRVPPITEISDNINNSELSDKPDFNSTGIICQVLNKKMPGEWVSRILPTPLKKGTGYFFGYQFLRLGMMIQPTR
jgi:hypothetical protein